MAKKVTLHFDPELSLNQEEKHVRDGLSTVLHTGDNLWLSCDERTTIERLTQQKDGSFGTHKSFCLSDYLQLPDSTDSEIDIEGMGMENNYLWLVGSHSLKRKKPRKDDSVAKQMKRLAQVKSDQNRYLLARIPVIKDEKTSDYTLCKECPDPDNPKKALRAAQLKGGESSSDLLEALKKDDHIAPFLTIPGKDNGFDIEGLATSGNKLYLGLRGPVLRGWAIVLELELEEAEEGFLKLKQLTPERPYKKHFLHLKGKGIRELRILGNDMYILAGPTMDLDGVIAVYRWRNVLKQKGESMVHTADLERLCEVPHGHGAESGKDKAEGLAVYDERNLMVVFDSPRDARKVGEHSVIADLIKID
ncbi:DUF3616 domain-containing protein [Pontibacter sp. KCTC 32443]|uniref:DUF3616 domain-containing protein n=1 Tax=Pontibacter TaxID=323449 RepID=UPI00164E0025|nr:MULTISPECIES: DUF3616 domain-containing protein [Pontibacter]MBC5776007.1 DUF3616 domain-containing protein [Pontibacter sp. KCTC 32443]